MASAQKKPGPSQPRRAPSPPPGLGNDTALTAVAHLKRIVALLVLVCLVISTCLNIYMFRENAVLQGRFEGIQGKLGGYTDMDRFLRRLTMELQSLRRECPQVADLFKKYSYFEKYKLDDVTRGTPQR